MKNWAVIFNKVILRVSIHPSIHPLVHSSIHLSNHLSSKGRYHMAVKKIKYKLVRQNPLDIVEYGKRSWHVTSTEPFSDKSSYTCKPAWSLLAGLQRYISEHKVRSAIPLVSAVEKSFSYKVFSIGNYIIMHSPNNHSTLLFQLIFSP